MLSTKAFTHTIAFNPHQIPQGYYYPLFHRRVSSILSNLSQVTTETSGPEYLTLASLIPKFILFFFFFFLCYFSRSLEQKEKDGKSYNKIYSDTATMKSGSKLSHIFIDCIFVCHVSLITSNQLIYNAPKIITLVLPATMKYEVDCDMYI